MHVHPAESVLLSTAVPAGHTHGAQSGICPTLELSAWHGPSWGTCPRLCQPGQLLLDRPSAFPKCPVAPDPGLRMSRVTSEGHPWGLGKGSTCGKGPVLYPPSQIPLFSLLLKPSSEGVVFSHCTCQNKVRSTEGTGAEPDAGGQGSTEPTGAPHSHRASRHPWCQFPALGRLQLLPHWQRNSFIMYHKSVLTAQGLT